MKRVTGIGGIFFRSKDKKASAEWYRKHLGVPTSEWGGAIFPWKDAENPEKEGMTVWNAFDADTKYFGDTGQTFMVNYIVEDLDALLTELKKEGVTLLDGPKDDGFGKFAWIADPDGNRVELWQPNA